MLPRSELPNATGRERRSYARHHVDSGTTFFPVDLSVRFRGRILDVSLGGGRIRAAERFPVGIYRRVEFTLDRMPFQLAGVVQALHDPGTIGSGA